MLLRPVLWFSALSDAAVSVGLVRAIKPVRPVPAPAASRGSLRTLQSADGEGDVGHLTE